jgi:HEAT repeat protein
MTQGRIVLSLLLLCAPLCAQEVQDLDELWRVGCQWQVGENIPKVEAARNALIESGPPGLKYALGKLGASNTLEIRCLTAVIRGFGNSAVDPLTERIAHKDAHARRNVADLLLALKASGASPALLKQAKVEDSLSARLAQLSALAKWNNHEAAPIAIEVSRDKSQRARERTAGLLAAFDTPLAGARLIELLEDDAYYVRTAAVEALKTGPLSARAACLARGRKLSATGENAGLFRRMLPVVATLADPQTPELLKGALAHTDSGVRAEAATALAAWKKGAGALEELNVDALLEGTLKKEVDPFVRAEIESARRTLPKTE